MNQDILDLLDCPRVLAMLALIRHTEGTDPNRFGHDPYRVVYGYGFEIADLSRHPADPALGPSRWLGEKLPDAYCKAAGLKPGCVSTAAGAYQFTRPTWTQFAALAGAKDFGEVSQDGAAVALLRYEDAIDSLLVGDTGIAIERASKRWASLPGSKSKQPQYSMARALELFNEKLEGLA